VIIPQLFLRRFKMIAEAREKLRKYDLASVARLGITRSPEHFGSSHTVVTYFPLNTLGKMHPDELFFSRLRGTEQVNLYTHIPFCKSKCGYCSYVGEPAPTQERIGNYLLALSEELRMYGSILQGRKIVSVYIGGGTPTLLTSKQLSDRLIEPIRKRLNVDENAPLCVEANPTTLVGKEGKEKVRTLKEIGTNRLSIGVQTFNDNILRAIGRGYSTGEDARATIQFARDAGIPVLNVDMMQDLPGQTLEDIEADLQVISELRPNSVTWYTMRTNSKCWLHNRHKRVSEEDSLVARIMITDGLKQAGYTQISGDRFSLTLKDRDQFKEARSSITSDMLGMGVSAYSHLDDLIFRNETDIDEYMKIVAKGRFPVSNGKQFTKEERVIAQFVLGLKNGLELNDLAKTFLVGSIWSCVPYHLGVGKEGKLLDVFRNYAEYRKKIPQLIGVGLLEFDGNRLQFTEKGRLFEHEICRFLYSPIVDAETRGHRIRAFLKKIG